MEQQPLISIIVPTYNRKKTLPDTIDSIMKQTYTNWELIIVDDGSTDGTREFVGGLSVKDPRIKYLYNGKNKGPSAARNNGIKNSSGEYIAFLDSDDQWLENHLMDSMTALHEENLDVCFSLWLEKYSNGEMGEALDNDIEREKIDIIFGTLNPVIHQNRVVFSSPEYLEFTSSVCAFYCTHINTMVFKREILKTTGLLNEKLRASEDLEFITRVIHYYSFCWIRNFHFIYNQGEDNIHSFMDKRNYTVEDIMADRRIVDKLTFCGVYKGLVFKMVKDMLKKSDRIRNKDGCMEKSNRHIGSKYFSLGYINKKTHPMKAVYYIVKSLPYKCNAEKIKTLINIIFPFAFRNFKVNEKALRYY